MSLTASLKDEDRIRDLCQTGVLDSAPEESFDRYIRMAKGLIDAPIMLVSLVDRERQFFKAHSGLPDAIAAAQQTPLTHSFCQYVVHLKTPLIISDARENDLVRNNGAIQDLGVIAYLGMPLLSLGDRVLGSFCVIDTKPRAWTDQEIDRAADLAASISAELQLRASRSHIDAAKAVRARSLAAQLPLGKV